VFAIDTNGCAATDNVNVTVIDSLTDGGFSNASDKESQFEMQELEISLFPNPSKGVVNLEINSLAGNVVKIEWEVFTILGQKVFEWEGSVENFFSKKIELSKFGPCQFFSRIQIDGEVFVRKIVLF
jgi:hypothetical protein